MRSLAMRIALLLVAAIVSVVILSSLAASLVMRGPRPETTIEPLARQLHILARIMERDTETAKSAGAVTSPAPAEGVEDPRFSRFLSEALRRTGESRRVIVTRKDGWNSGSYDASLQLDNGYWLLMPVPDFGPPPGGWKLLVGWLMLIIAGSTLVSVFAAAKITKPLRLLEKALGDIGPDGMLPYIPETGSGEIRATAQALNRLSTRVKAATESRMRLVAAAGHDLRTPMTRMRLRAEFIRDDEDRLKWLADLEELDKIADSAIGLVREEISKDSLQHVRLDLIVANIVEELTAVGLNVRSEDLQPTMISVGPLAVTRALRNLLINAATHGESAAVTVSQVSGQAVVRIVDTGPGIPEERLSQVFEPFFRINIGRQKSSPGAGLGMAIAREIISRFEGTITVRNRQPRGLEQVIVFKSFGDQLARNER